MKKIFTLCLLICAFAVPVRATHSHLTIHTEDGQYHYISEIADTDALRNTGLMHRTSLDNGHAMLFIYSSARVIYMWMKNTLIPLDMLFISDELRVMHIHHHAIPHDLTPVSSRYPVKYVLEIPAGDAKNHGFSVGNRVTIYSDE